MTTARKRRSVAGKLVASAALIGGALSLAFGGAFATFTDTASGSPQAISSGTISIGATSVNSTAANNIVPGDTVAREVDLSSNGATAADASITLALAATTSSLLNTDPTNGLQLSVQDCAVAPTLVANSYSCSAAGGFTPVTIGGSTSVSVSSLLAGPATLGGLTSLAPNKTDHLVMNLTFPSTAPGDLSQLSKACSGTAGGSSSTENLEGCSTVLAYTLTPTQRAGSAQ